MYQQTIIMGNLGRDPEMRYLPDGTAVTNMSVATNKKWTDKGTGEAREITTWFRVAVWGRQAEPVAEYLKSGSMVLVIGELQPDPQTGGPKLFNKQDGSVGSSFELKAFQVKFLPGQMEGSGDNQGESSSSKPSEEDEIPF